MKETRMNLQHDWVGLLDWYNISEEGKKEIMKAVVYEIDCYKKMSLWGKLLNKTPKHSFFE